VDDPPTYSDPIIIPITMTIPWPHEAWRRSAGRFDIDGQANPPDFNTPERRAFERMLAAQNDVLAHQARIDAAMYAYASEARARRAATSPVPERLGPNIQDAAADFTVPEWAPVPLPPLLMPDPPPPSMEAAIAEAARRAGRRLRYVGSEIEHGDVGAAAGHLLGTPYPAEVDDPAGTVFHNETPKPEEARAPELDAAADLAERDLEKRRGKALDERHHNDAEQDRLGNPVLRPDGEPFQHDNEVNEAQRGLQREIRALRKKIDHYDQFVDPPPVASIKRAQQILDKLQEFLNESRQRVPRIKSNKRGQ
jgi:hypothetical protein